MTRARLRTYQETLKLKIHENPFHHDPIIIVDNTPSFRSKRRTELLPQEIIKDWGGVNATSKGESSDCVSMSEESQCPRVPFPHTVVINPDERSTLLMRWFPLSATYIRCVVGSRQSADGLSIRQTSRGPSKYPHFPLPAMCRFVMNLWLASRTWWEAASAIKKWWLSTGNT